MLANRSRNGRRDRTRTRSRNLAARELSETILHRAGFLDPPDRLLLEQVLGKEVRPRDVARLSGSSARAVQRRVRNLMRRLTDPAVEFVLRHHYKWSRPVASVALAVWVRAWTLRETADGLQMTLHQVRQHVHTIQGLIDEAGQGGRRRPRAGRRRSFGTRGAP